MQILDLHSVSLAVLIPIFLVSAGLVYYAGTRLSKLTDSISDRTGLGKAFVGSLFLGGITSLPEVATTISATIQNNPGMATNNLLGGVAMQIALLSIADAFLKKESLSSLSSNAVILLQGVALILSLSVLAAFVLAPGFTIFYIGIGSVVIFILFLASLYIIQRFRFLYWLRYNPHERSSLQEQIEKLQERVSVIDEEKIDEQEDKSNETLKSALLSREGAWLLGLSLLIFIGGFMVVRSCEAIAEQTGLGTNIAGFVLVAIATSLPELSTTISAVKIKQYELAFSNIFGTNLFDIALITVADLFYLQGSIFREIGDFALLGCILGIAVTSIYMLGLIVRSPKQIFRVGYDSLLVVIVYLCGVAVLFTMK